MNLNKTLDIAEEIFFDLAAENLNSEKMQLLQTHASSFYIEVQESFSDWQEIANIQAELEDYVELVFFIEMPNAKSELLAKMLLSLDDDDKEAHIEWI